MSQTITFSVKAALAGGGSLNMPEAKRVSTISTNTYLTEEVLNDRNWMEIDILGGDRSQIEFLVLSADRYQDDNAREDEPGLLFKFEDENFALRLDGALLYSGHTVSCLPAKLERIYIQNRMAAKVKIYLLLGRKQAKAKKNANGVANAAAPAANGAVQAANGAAQAANGAAQAANAPAK